MLCQRHIVTLSYNTKLIQEIVNMYIVFSFFSWSGSHNNNYVYVHVCVFTLVPDIE